MITQKLKASVFCSLALAFTAGTALAQQPAGPEEADQFGGVHELNLYVGHSFHGGPALGYVRNALYTDVMARYSYQVAEYRYGTLRWAPEVTLFANLFEQSPSPNQIHTNVPLRSYGAGLSVVDFQFVALPHKRVQPFFNADGGFVLYNNPVLSDGGTKFMFTVDYGLGANIFLNKRDAMVVGFRYDHQSNANVGQHNPGEDNEIFFVGYSHFFNLHGRQK